MLFSYTFLAHSFVLNLALLVYTKREIIVEFFMKFAFNFFIHFNM